jgi:hypothetical protein
MVMHLAPCVVEGSLFHLYYMCRNVAFHINVWGELVFSVLVAGWFCEKSGGIGKVEDVKPVL